MSTLPKQNRRYFTFIMKVTLHFNIISVFFIVFQLESEIEKHLLSTTVTLSDGTTGFVFSRNKNDGVHAVQYNCHLCSVSNLPGERCLQTHIAGRKHQTKLAMSSIDSESFRASLVQKNRSKFKNY